MVGPKQGLGKWRSQGSFSNWVIRMGRLLTAPLLKWFVSINFIYCVTTLKIQYPGKESLINLLYVTCPPLAGRTLAGWKKEQCDYQSHKVSNEGNKGDSPKRPLDPATNIRIRKGGHTDTNGQAQTLCNLLTSGDWAMQSFPLATWEMVPGKVPRNDHTWQHKREQ